MKVKDLLEQLEKADPESDIQCQFTPNYQTRDTPEPQSEWFLADWVKIDNLFKIVCIGRD